MPVQLDHDDQAFHVQLHTPVQHAAVLQAAWPLAEPLQGGVVPPVVVRLRSCVPPPQAAEQLLHEPHWLHWHGPEPGATVGGGGGGGEGSGTTEQVDSQIGIWPGVKTELVTVGSMEPRR